MIETIIYKNNEYPLFQTQGFASQFIIPYAKHICTGFGVDVGCNRMDWCLPGAMPIDPVLNDFDALNIPFANLDYIFSSHCLEHLDNWVDVLDYWDTKLKVGGIMFLYLPDYSQEYWRPWNNRKHKNIFTPTILEDYFIDKEYSKIFKSGVDLNNSFSIFAEKN